MTITIYFSSELALRLGDTPGVSTLPEEKHSCLHALQVAWLFLYPNHTPPLLASARALSVAYIAHSLMQQTAQQLYWETACFVFLIWKTKARCKLRWLGIHTSLTQSKKEKKRRKHPLVKQTLSSFLAKFPVCMATLMPLFNTSWKRMKSLLSLFSEVNIREFVACKERASDY